MSSHQKSRNQSISNYSIHTQIGPYDEVEQAHEAPNNHSSCTNNHYHYNNELGQTEQQDHILRSTNEIEKKKKIYGEINASKYHSVEDISREHSRRVENLNGMARRKASHSRNNRNNILLHSKNRSRQDRIHDRDVNKPSKIEIYRAIDFDRQDQKYEDSDSLKTRNMVIIQLNQWNEYWRQLRRWIRYAYRQSRVTFCYPPVPPRHLIFGVPYLLVYFIQLILCNILNICFFKPLKNRNQIFTIFFYALTSVSVIVTIVGFVVIRGFYKDATKICIPPNDYWNPLTYPNPSIEGQPRPRPFVEYYVHGRGNGHYSRSIAIIRKLNAAGIDVRMFIGRASMWKQIQPNGSDKKENPQNSVISNLSIDANKARRVAKLLLFSEETGSLLQDLTRENIRPTEEIHQLADIFDKLPWENEYALHYNFASHPDLLQLNEKDLQSNDEVTGTTTAISVASLIPKLTFLSTISHAVERITGDCAVSHQTSRYPNLVISDGDAPGMLRAKLGNIPSVSISHGTTFVISKTNWNDNERNWKSAWHSQAFLNLANSFFSDWSIGTNFIPLEVKGKNSVIAKPPFRREVLDVAKIRSLREKRFLDGNEISEGELGTTKRNKLVLCYFRDKNGLHVVNILLELGFDVVVFNPAGEEQVAQTGKKWKIPAQRKGIEISWSNSDPNDHHFDIRDFSLASSSNNTGSDASEENKSFPSNPRIPKRNLHESSTIDQNNKHDQTLDRNTLLQMFSSTSNEPRVIKVYDKNLFVAFMGIVDGIVGSGGSQLLSESIYGRIPMLGLHRDDDSEQMLNIEMLRRKRDEDRQNLITKQESLKIELRNSKDGSIYAEQKMKISNSDLPPENYGTSIETFLSTFSTRNNDSEVLKDKKFRTNRNQKLLQSESVLARKELQGFVDTIRNSVISESYYNDIFHFLNSPDDKNIAKRMKEPNNENDASFPNKWLDGMPDAAEVITEIVHELA